MKLTEEYTDFVRCFFEDNNDYWFPIMLLQYFIMKLLALSGEIYEICN